MSTNLPRPGAPVSQPESGDQFTIDDSSFAEILLDYEREQAAASEVSQAEVVNGIVVAVRSQDVLVDVGRKVEGVLPLERWREVREEEPQAGHEIPVSVGPHNEEGYYQLTTQRVERPRDWSALEAAMASKAPVAGTVVEQVKGGFRVDIGVRAFMPASRSGIREMQDMPSLVGQQIACRITKIDTEKEDVVVDRRALLEEEQVVRREQVFNELREGAVVRGRVRNVMDFGAFVDLGGVDGLLHVAELSHTRVAKASDVLKPGDELEVKILKVDGSTRKISLSLKALQEDPWTAAARTLQVGDRVSGTVSRLADFGAFVELLPGVDGLIHVSELSWNKKVRKPGDLLKVGERVDAVILGVNIGDRRISLGYKQALGDPWETVPSRFPAGAVVEGAVSNLTPFGAFVDLGDGLEGMIHISDVTNERRIDHPREKLAKGQRVRAQVLEVDSARRRLRLGLRQLEPTVLDTFISEHQQGDTVSGRLVEVHGSRARVELGEGVFGTWELAQANGSSEGGDSEAATREAGPLSADVGSLGAMLAARWKSGGGPSENVQRKMAARAGEIRSFRIRTMDAARKLIELELAS